MTTTDPTAGQPATPGEALRYAADHWAHPGALRATRQQLHRWADKLDAAAPPATPGELDLDAVEREWLVQCGPCDCGLVEMGCNCPDGDYRPPMAKLVAEVRRLRGELDAARAAAPTTYALPAEPPEHVRRLWGHGTDNWIERTADGWRVEADEYGEYPTVSWLAVLLAQRRLSTTPPAGTEASNAG